VELLKNIGWVLAKYRYTGTTEYRPQERQRKTGDRDDKWKSGWSWTALSVTER